MNTRIAIVLSSLILFLAHPGPLGAQDTAQPTRTTQTLTGCIQRGEAVSAFKLISKDGVWNLGGTKKLKLDRQVDHTVTVTGKIEETFDSKTSEKEHRDPKLRGIFNVRKFAVVNASCSPDQL